MYTNDIYGYICQITKFLNFDSTTGIDMSQKLNMEKKSQTYHIIVPFNEGYDIFCLFVPYKDMSTITATDDVITVRTNEIHSLH